MRTLIYCTLLLVLCACDKSVSRGDRAHRPGAVDTDRPNILFILTDDQGIGDLSLHDNDSLRTPNMDALLTSGARFDRFYVSPVCAPTRASFLSGLYHPRTGAIFVTRRRENMDDGITTLAEHLQAAGYRTGLYGKWHNGATFPYHPGGQGFDEFLGFTLGHFNNYFDGELRDERDRPVPFHGDLTGILTDSAAQFMIAPDDDDDEQPFFCMIAYQAPHTPVQVADRYWNEPHLAGLSDYNRGIYAMVESIDDRLGQLIDRLDNAGKLDNTIIVFATDNGPNGDRYRMGLKGTKGQVDEGGVRVPFAIRLPGRHSANGKIFSTPAAHIDLLPTVLDLLDLPTTDSLDGISLVPLLDGGDLADRYLYTFKQGYNYTGYPGSMRDDRYLYVANDSSHHELYDLQEDPGQTTDIFTRSTGRGERMAGIYRDFATGIGRPDLVAPPIDLGAAPGAIRLLAHEGEPLGDTRFQDTYGWANDYFVGVDEAGGQWPVTLAADVDYTVTIEYQLTADAPVKVSVYAGNGNQVEVMLAPALTEQIAVPDRVTRKEVYPRAWAVSRLGQLSVTAASKRLTIAKTGRGGELWIKSVELRRVDSATAE